MPHECTHPRYIITRNFNHYICNTIYIFHHNLKFKARQSTSRHIVARHAGWMYTSTLCNNKKINHYICNAPYIFHCNKKFKARYSTSWTVAARHATRMYVHIDVSSHVKWGQNISIITSICITTYIVHHNTKYQSSSQHVAARYATRMYTSRFLVM
jgi:hypothetical protein